MYVWQIIRAANLSCGQPNYEFLQHFLLWVGPIDDVDMRTVACVASIILCGLASAER